MSNKKETCFVADQEDRMDTAHDSQQQTEQPAPFYEVTVASVDQPKLLSRLSEALVSAAPGLCNALITMIMISCRSLCSLLPAG
jgi:hypothetical protein